MKKIVPQIIFSLLFTIGIYAQELSKPEVVEQFTIYQTEELQELFSDAFSRNLQKYPGSIGFIEVFGEENRAKGLDYAVAERFKIHLIKYRGIEPERIVSKVCADDGAEVKLTIVPANFDYKGCSDDIKYDFSKTLYFANYWYSMPDDFGSCCFIGELQAEEAQATLKAAAEILKNNDELQIYLIAYSCSKCGINKAKNSPKLADKMLKDAADYFVKNGIDKSKISTKKSKSKDGRFVEIYFVPKNGEIPKPKPDYFPNSSKRKE